MLMAFSYSCHHYSEITINLMDKLYIGKAIDFYITNHAIAMKFINKIEISFDKVALGYVKNGEKILR